MTYHEALELRHRYFGGDVPVREIHESDACWFFTHQLIGSFGMMIDKADGHVMVLGSGLSLDEWLYAYRHGFRHGDYTLRVTVVHNAEATVRILGQELRYDHDHLRSVVATPPFDLHFGHRQYPFLSLLKLTPHFGSEFIVTGCENQNCTAVGARISLRD